MDSLPGNVAPPQLIACAAQMPEADRYKATRCGPGTVRDPLDTAREDDDASNESSGESSNEGVDEGGEEPVSKNLDSAVNQFETPLGIDPSATPDFV